MPVTIRDVAKLAGVSPSVVSKVLHDRGGNVRVGPETSERVRATAEELGYKVNVWARNFKAQRSHAIAVIHGLEYPHPFFAQGSLWFSSLMDGVVRQSFKHGFSVTLCPELLLDGGMTLDDGRFDGFVWFITYRSKEGQEFSDLTPAPVVLVHSRSEDFGGKHPAVICDNEQGMTLALDHLLGLGHTRIIVASAASDSNVDFQIRCETFLRYMRAKGLPAGPDQIVAMSHEGTELREILRGTDLPTAIITSDENLGATVLHVAQDEGYRIPRDLSVVAFDSTPFCEQTRPRLTAVSQPFMQMAAKAIDMLVSNIEGGEHPPKTVMFACGLDIRESTDRPGGQRSQ